MDVEEEETTAKETVNGRFPCKDLCMAAGEDSVLRNPQVRLFRNMEVRLRDEPGSLPSGTNTLKFYLEDPKRPAKG